MSTGSAEADVHANKMVPASRRRITETLRTMVVRELDETVIVCLNHDNLRLCYCSYCESRMRRMDRCRDRRRRLPVVLRVKILGPPPAHMIIEGYYNTAKFR